MSVEVPREAAGAAAPARPARRVFAAPSKEGLLICAASLMPAYLFGLMGLVNLFSLGEMIAAGPEADPRGVAAGLLQVGHQALTTSFSLLVGWLFLIRRPSLSGRGPGGILADVVAVGGTVIALGISMAPRTMQNVYVLATAEALLTLGLVIMVVSVTSLGRSFGVMPRARGLVLGGMYRYVRHPIYLGEFLAFAGLLLLTLSPFTIGVYVGFTVLQLWRMVEEEKTLLAAYPEYDEYRAHTARVLPGVY